MDATNVFFRSLYLPVRAKINETNPTPFVQNIQKFLNRHYPSIKIRCKECFVNIYANIKRFSQSPHYIEYV